MQQLIQNIEQLSPQSRTHVAKYVEFLQWQESQSTVGEAQGWSFSFIEAFKEADIHASENEAGMDIKMAPATVQGQPRPALWAHPPLVGQAVIEYFIPIPRQVSEVQLRLAIGIRDGAKIDESNLVAFGLKINGMRVWGRQSNASTWQEAEIPLNLASGDIARLEFTTEALGSHKWTWAVWGNPELVGKLSSS